MTNGAPIHIKPEQAISEAAALGEKIARGVALFSKLHDDDVAIATTPKASPSAPRERDLAPAT